MLGLQEKEEQDGVFSPLFVRRFIYLHAIQGNQLTIYLHVFCGG